VVATSPSDRDAEDVGDVRQWKTQVMVEDDLPWMVDRKPPEALPSWSRSMIT
jgi:hypothetical protein